METTIEIDDEIICVWVSYSYTPAEPMVWTYRNGDPGHPGSPAEVELLSVEGKHDGKEYIDLIGEEQCIELQDKILALKEKNESYY